MMSFEHIEKTIYFLCPFFLCIVSLFMSFKSREEKSKKQIIILNVLCFLSVTIFGVVYVEFFYIPPTHYIQILLRKPLFVELTGLFFVIDIVVFSMLFFLFGVVIMHKTIKKVLPLQSVIFSFIASSVLSPFVLLCILLRAGS